MRCGLERERAGERTDSMPLAERSDTIPLAPLTPSPSLHAPSHTIHAQIVAFRAGASDRKTIVQRALSRVGEKGYNVCQQLSAVRLSTQHALMLSALAASVFDVPVICLLSCTMGT